MKASTMKNAPEGKCFYFNNGKNAKNLRELHKEIKKMDNEMYSAFVDSTKNDFYNWINDVLCHKKLAMSIKRVKAKETIVKKIEENLPAKRKCVRKKK